LPYWPYDPGLRLEVEVAVEVEAVAAPARLEIPTGEGETTRLRQVGSVRLPSPGEERVSVWWLEQYAGGIFRPIRGGFELPLSPILSLRRSLGLSAGAGGNVVDAVLRAGEKLSHAGYGI